MAPSDPCHVLRCWPFFHFAEGAQILGPIKTRFFFKKKSGKLSCCFRSLRNNEHPVSVSRLCNHSPSLFLAWEISSSGRSENWTKRRSHTNDQGNEVRRERKKIRFLARGERKGFIMIIRGYFPFFSQPVMILDQHANAQ